MAEWLRSCPNIQIVSRDGSVSCKSAIEQAGMDIQQASDRFHLLRGLTDAAKKFISRLLSANFMLPTEASHYDGKLTGDYWDKPIKEDPVIGRVYDAVSGFKQTLLGKKESELDKWLEETDSLEI